MNAQGPVYSLDSSALIHGWRRAYRPRNFVFVWTNLDGLIAEGRLRASVEVYREMERRLGAPGEFARAYVIAHEVGHHVQRQLGYSKRAAEAEKTMRPENRHDILCKSLM